MGDNEHQIVHNSINTFIGGDPITIDIPILHKQVSNC